jgi:predicted transcriptional regulator
MRTTVTLDDDLFARAKQEAAASGRTLSQVVEDALRDRLTARPEPEKPFRVKLHTFGSGGVKPGVDISDNAGVRDVMDGLA